ncbi:MAG: ketopantoate reductase C-terminal domain-containing protein [Eubacteriales bacterium]|nr:ketopantoate reductase C-terminal domain-containing protein [Eubacteriales bacterium]
MRIQSVALIGAGAVGAWFIPGLSYVYGDRFSVIAEGERAEKLKREGVVINGRRYKPQVRSAVEAGSLGVDLLIVATKYDAIPDILHDIKTITELGKILKRELADPAGTIVLSPLNGIDAEEQIAKEIGEEHMLWSFMRIVSARKGNEIVISPTTRDGLIFGEKHTKEKTERCRAIEMMLMTCGINGRFSDSIITEMWQKFAFNLSTNLPQAVFGVGYGAYLDSEHVAYIHDCLAFETIMVARKLGIVIDYQPNTRNLAMPGARFSTLQDLDAGRKTEIEMLAGVLMKKAAEVDIPVPFTEYTYHAIKALEEKNAGLFDYEV